MQMKPSKELFKLLGERMRIEKKKMADFKYELGIWDHREVPYDSLEKILKKLNVYMYEIPSFEGSDTFGFVFSNKKLTKDEIKQIDNEIFHGE